MLDVIILRSVYGKVGQKYFIQPCANPRTGQFAECVKSIDSNGDMILSESDKEKMSDGTAHFIKINDIFVIEDGYKLDLTTVLDKAIWEAIKHTNIIAPERSAKDAQGNLLIDGSTHRYGAAELYVERPGEMTKARVSKKQYIFNAQRYIYEDSESERVKKSKVLGRDLSNATVADVLDFMLGISEKDPHRIIELYEDDDWKMQLFVIDAVERGVIHKKGGIYSYEDKLLGGSIDATIAMLKDVRYRNFLNAIKKETYPEYSSKEELEALEKETTKNIPQFEEGVKPKKASGKTTKK